jgi:polyisoprenoid-binding protein YceI
MAQLDTQQTGTTICPPQGTWVIDPVHSTIEFSVRHLMAAKVRGHFTQYTETGSLIVGKRIEVDIDIQAVRA